MSTPLPEEITVTLQSVLEMHDQFEYEPEVRKKGLLLKHASQKDVKIYFGNYIRYNGQNEATIELDGLQYHLTVNAPLTVDADQLTADLVEFVKGERPDFRLDDYRHSTKTYLLYGLVLSPLGLVLVSFGGIFPSLLGVVIMGACYYVSRSKELPYMARIIIIAVMSTAGYIAYLIMWSIWSFLTYKPEPPPPPEPVPITRFYDAENPFGTGIIQTDFATNC